MNIEKKTVLITGSSSGIGKELAFVYARNNFNLVLAARNITELNKIKIGLENKSSITVFCVEIDLSEQNSAEKLYKIVKTKDLIIDILINNAGYGLNGNFIDLDINSQINMMTLNMITLTKLSHFFAKDMIKQSFGNIVNIASTASFQPISGFAVYAATKAFVLNFSEAFSQELKDTNVNITTICPGATKSNFFNKSGINKVNFIGVATSKQVAEFTYKSVKKNRVIAIHGFMNNILAFSIRFTPRFLIRKISGKFFD